MLTVLASHEIRPAVETIDRDPGIVSLIAAIVRSVRCSGRTASVRFRISHPPMNTAIPFSSSTSWPHLWR